MPRLRVVLATQNKGKAREFDRLLKPALSVVSMPESVRMPEETGQTFAANARLKAEHVAGVMGPETNVLADDSGLEVERLGGRPGVLSARFAGAEARDEENVAKLLGELEGERDRRARFVCNLCLVLSEEMSTSTGVGVVEVTGELRGQIELQPRGSDGFGYDPVFRPSGWEMSLGEAPPGDKDEVSHRGAASRALLERLDDLGLTERRRA